FSLHCALAPPDLLSFPTRRSSDLGCISSKLLINRSGHKPQHSLGRILTLPSQFQESMSGARTFLSAATYGSSARSGHFGGRSVRDRKSTRLNSSHDQISYAVFCLK